MNERAHAIFNHAQIYDKAACLLNSSGAQDPALLLPSIVNAALSLELYFKSVYILDHGADFKINGKHSHNFHALFDALHDSTKQFITAHFDAAISSGNNSDLPIYEKQFKITIAKEFVYNIGHWSSIFTDLRYAYEFTDKNAGKQRLMLFYPEIRNSIHAVVINRVPEWASA